jgi:CBS domain-containing protein
MHVSGFMVPADKAVTCLPSHPIENAVDKLLEHKISAVVVVNEDKKPVGIVTKTDITKAYKAKVPLETKTESVMTQGIETVNENTPKDLAADLFQKSKLHHMIVVNNAGEFAGIISTMDIARESALDAKAWPYLRSETSKSTASTESSS